MEVRVYTVYDAKSSSFQMPQYYVTPGVAERSFGQAVNTEETTFNMFPEDYTLFEIGVFDDSNACFKLYDAPKEIVKALQLKKVD